MCAGLILPADTLCEKQRELGNALGIVWRELPLKAGYTDDAHHPDGCLCPIDFDVLAVQYGWKLDYMTDPFNVTAKAS